GTFTQSGQFQVIIGNTVSDFYNDFTEVSGISGIGLMIGISLKSKKAGDVAKAALENGLLVLTAKEKVRLLPPLTITYEEIDEGINILAEIMK
ncbi:MAG: aminotransferase class III-fold pyridoxal phosphate-dependent enzyme, partial [Ruminiclostridium sp.]|nr:aminotransferase class III-fold pyridoxal phosphate-dependent enzyme [Ruminiclostridium sp.]